VGWCAPRRRGAGHSASGWCRLQRAKCSRPDGPGTPGQPVRERQRRGRRGWERGDQGDERSFLSFFSDTAPTLTPAVDTGLVGQHPGACAATPGRVEGAMRAGGWLNEALEGLCEGTGHLRGAPGARALHHPLPPWVGKAIAPLAESRRRQGEGIRDGLETRPLHNGAHGLGTAEDAGFFGRLYAGVSGRERISRKGQCEGPPLSVSRNQILQTYAYPPSPCVVPLFSVQNLADSNFSEAA
jgi:hypothetical protein